MEDSQRDRLREVAWVFLRLGTIAFGGPAAHVAMMQEEVVRRRAWVGEQQFLDLLSAANLIPGPNSTELAIHLGHERAGWRGLLLAGTCFILPAAFIVGVLGWVYVEYGALPQVGWLLYGVKPAILAVIVQALYNLGFAAIKSRGLLLLGLASFVALLFGFHELLVLFGAGLVWVGGAGVGGGRLFSLAPGPVLLALAVPPTSSHAFSLSGLFLFFAKVGSVLFGSGYVLLAFLRSDLVERWHWLTEAQLLDAIAVGQVTPGPVFTTATFIGYLLGGPAGAAVATVGIFLPAFVFVALTRPILPRLRRSKVAGAFLDGVNVSSLALMAAVTWHLARSAVMDWLTLGIAAASAVALLRFRINSAWLVLGGGIAGWIARAAL
jgi:chromate transporter